uniref:Nuclear FMR1 interacting protein 2 n=1 Tax=Erpetoichthys calabaricus TaxID=27687 RepID=A0A8C4X789_ERPCA
MEEQPCVRAHHHRHADEAGNPNCPPTVVKHEQNHEQGQPSKTSKKKTGDVKVNGSTTDKDSSGSPKSQDSRDVHVFYPNGPRTDNRHQVDSKTRPKRGFRFTTHFSFKLGHRVIYSYKNVMDRRNGKPLESRLREGKAIDKREAVPLLNGVLPFNVFSFANGYPNKSAHDNDGSGSESGYTTPKKRKARCNSIKSCDNLSFGQDKTMQQESSPLLKKEFETIQPDLQEKLTGKLEGIKTTVKSETSAGLAATRPKPVSEIQKKNSELKLCAAGKKNEDRLIKSKLTSAVPTKEDSWTLFKPPPVFPVDNSSAKIVPKISYASKVKENLNKAAQGVGDAVSSRASGKLSQVPMSAMKAVSSPCFTNGPMSTDCNSCEPQALFTPAASTVISPSFSEGESEVSSPDSGCLVVSAKIEQKKANPFSCPLNMQPQFSSISLTDIPLSQTNQQTLGDIFQNQWGLSFINEPSAGPEASPSATDSRMTEVTFQGDYPSALTLQGPEILPSGPECLVFPKAFEFDKRTSPPNLSGILKSSLVSGCESGASTFEAQQIFGDELQKTEDGKLGAILFVQSPPASPTNPVLAFAKDQRCRRDFDRRDSWGSFDLRAAVIYHTKGNVILQKCFFNQFYSVLTVLRNVILSNAKVILFF